jgi:hypothetical protein
LVDTLFGTGSLTRLLALLYPRIAIAPQILLASGSPAELCDALAVVIALCPLEARPAATFSTYCALPERSRCRIIGNNWIKPERAESMARSFQVFIRDRVVPSNAINVPEEALSYALRITELVGKGETESALELAATAGRQTRSLPGAKPIGVTITPVLLPESAAVGADVVDAVGDTAGVGPEVVIEDSTWGTLPTPTRITEVAYEFAFLCVGHTRVGLTRAT